MGRWLIYYFKLITIMISFTFTLNSNISIHYNPWFNAQDEMTILWHKLKNNHLINTGE